MSQPPARRSLEARPEPSSPASLAALLEGLPALIWETDQHLRFTNLLGAAVEPLGVSTGRWLGQPVGDLFSACGDGIGIWQAHEIALLGQDSSFEIALNGRELQASVKPLQTPEGAIRGVIGIAVDMTERMVAERALRISEHSYRSLIEDAPYAICRSTLGGQLLQVNRAMTEMLGYEGTAGAELLLRDLSSIFIPPVSFETFRRTVLDGDSHPGTDAAWVRRDGHAIQVRVNGRVVRDPAGRTSYLDVLAEDVTEKKRLEAELSQVQRMQAIGQLAGGVAHDFNNLLTVISGHVEMLLAGARDGESRGRLGEVKQAAEKAASLTRQLLAFSRRQVLRSRAVDLNEVIGKLMGMLSRLIKADVKLTFTPGEDLGSVRADPNEVERVLLNLAVNAQDAMPSGGRLSIETMNVPDSQLPAALQANEPNPEGYVQIVVRDTGVGMDEETQARAFEPFFTTKQPNEGTGLGLSVVYGVVRQSGGHVALESRPGAGTTFRIFLPRVTAAPVSVPDPPRLPSLPHGSETILLAEDDAAIRGLVGHALENLGYRVLSAADGVAALDVAAGCTGRIHMLLTDLVMPAVGGKELANRLRSTAPDLKIVFMSGYAGHAMARQELEFAGVCFLQKPFSIELLANTIRGVLDGTLA